MRRISHYDYLDAHLGAFYEAVGVRGGAQAAVGVSSAHGDKAYGYRQEWAAAGIPFDHGVCCLMLTYESPFSSESRQTTAGWVPPAQWVIENYEKRFRKHLPPTMTG